MQALLRKDWSPEQIAGRLRRRRHRQLFISHETIYGYIWDDLAELSVDMSRPMTLVQRDDAEDEDEVEYVTRGWNDRLVDVHIEDEQGKINLNTAYTDPTFTREVLTYDVFPFTRMSASG